MRPGAYLAAVGLVALAACAGLDPTGGPEAPPPAAPPAAYTPGQSYSGRNGWVEYLAGDAPVVVTVPHGGELAPAALPDRGCGTTVADLHTVELARAIRAAFHRRTGRYPHLVINRLRRRKLDPNRELAEAGCGAPEAEAAWREYHAFVEVARRAVLAGEGKGWYLDLHGHGHEAQRLELGYLLRDRQLDLSDAELDARAALRDSSSVATLVRAGAEPSLSALLRGPASLGTLYAEAGFPAVPSAADPRPGALPYFRGGYSTERHACALGRGTLCGVQVEANFTGVRDTEANRARFAEATVTVLDRYLATHLGITLVPAAAARDGEDRCLLPP